MAIKLSSQLMKKNPRKRLTNAFNYLLSGGILCTGDPVAQSVEHLTFNQVVVGSIPTRITTFSLFYSN